MALAVLAGTILSSRDPLLYAAAFLTVVGTVTFPVWFFQGIEQMKYLTIAQSSARLLTIPALMLFVRQPDHYLRAAVIQGAVPLLATLLIAPVLWKKCLTVLPARLRGSGRNAGRLARVQ
jgi:PST family polysaccharide transporter